MYLTVMQEIRVRQIINGRMVDINRTIKNIKRNIKKIEEKNEEEIERHRKMKMESRRK